MSLLQRYFNIRREEILPVLFAVLYFFFVLTAWFVVRPAREALGMQRGMDAIRWLFMGTAVITLAVNPVFGGLVSRFRRMTFITATYSFFAANLAIFWAILVFSPSAIGEVTGMIFYVWSSVFNLFITMVFWALMADRFAYDQSRRLFGIIAVGGTMGAIWGSSLAEIFAGRLGTPALLLIGAGFLMLGVLAAWALTRVQPDRPEAGAAAGPLRGADRAVIGGSAWDGFRSLLKSPYLLGISAYVLVLAVIVTFIYFTRLQMVAELGEGVDMRAGIFGRLERWTQTATLVLQLVVAGHIMRRLGVTTALVLLPLVVAAGFIGLAMVGTLVALVVFDSVFRAVQRAIMRPARETLFTVVSREDKYKTKALTDTFVYRAGDVVGAQTEGALARLGLGLAGLASFAVPLALVWCVLGLWLGRTQMRMARETEQDIPTEAVPT